ncbi:MAG: TIGR00730 family Rossman fold protein [Phycisphaerales bacterium]|nr:TIGR00730 family Rossman fold protein [Phycisphaerales bacterium]
MKSITVYCSASSSLDPGYYQTAEVVGRTLAERGIEMVYGGGGVGLMGAAARSCKAAGGRVTGVITEHLMTMEQGWAGCDELMVVESMRERKRLMMERAEGFLVLPGGIGTYEEFFEVLVGRLLEEHEFPIGILNDQDYFAPLRAILEHGIEHRFISAPTLGLVHFGSDPVALIDTLLQAERVEIDPDRFYPARST